MLKSNPSLSLVSQYYRAEYNLYQEENTTEENVLRFGEEQGISELPSFNVENIHQYNNSQSKIPRNDDVKFRPSSPTDYYPTASDTTAQTYLSQSDQDYADRNDDSYLAPTPKTTNQQRTIAGNVSERLIPVVKNPLPTAPKPTIASNIPSMIRKGRAPIRPPSPHSSTHRDDQGDSYV